MAFYDSKYKGPESGSGSYLKIEEGKNFFRFMGDVLPFDRYWKDGRPYRFEDKREIPHDIDINKFNGKKRIEHVWVVVAVKKDEKGKPLGIGELTISQTSIQKALMDYYNEEDYGDFTAYDITIIKNSGAATPGDMYKVIAKPPKAPTAEELNLYESFELKDLRTKYSKEAYNDKATIDAAKEEVDLDKILADVDDSSSKALIDPLDVFDGGDGSDVIGK